MPLALKARLNGFGKLRVWKAGVLRLGDHKQRVGGTIDNLLIKFRRRFRSCVGKSQQGSSSLQFRSVIDVQKRCQQEFFPLALNPGGRDKGTRQLSLPSVSAAPWGTRGAHCSPDRSGLAAGESDLNTRHRAMCPSHAQGRVWASLRTQTILPGQRFPFRPLWAVASVRSVPSFPALPRSRVPGGKIRGKTESGTPLSFIT